MTDLPLPLLGVVVVFALAELIWARRNGVPTYTRNETLASLGTAVINRIGVLASLGWKLPVFTTASNFVPWSIPTTAATVLLAFFVGEFFYYWYHRFSHEVPVLWTMHFVHHSSPEYNLLVAPRLSFLANFFSPIFFLPMALIGFAPELITGVLAFSLVLQFFLHTEAIGKLGPLEGIINTPSAHRVHHGTNPQYIDRNYGALLIIFDRIFGTYEPEGEKVHYGVTTGHWGYNPLKLQFLPTWMYLTGSDWKREKEATAPTPKAPKVKA